MIPCPRCEGPVVENAAVCAHCDAYLLEWDPVRGRLGPRARDERPGPRPTPDTDSERPAPIFGRHRIPEPLDTHRSLTVFRWLCGGGMALHALLVLTQIVEPSLLLLAWIVLWLPLDAFWRSTR